MAMGTDKPKGLRSGLEGSAVGGQGFFYYLYNKAEKLVSALYLVTSLMDKNEPLKESLRQRALDLLHEVFSIKDIRRDQDLLGGIVSDSTELVSLIEVGMAAGLVSEMNARLVRQELENLVKTINDEISKVTSYNQVPRSIFELSGGELLESLAKSRGGSSESQRSTSPGRPAEKGVSDRVLDPPEESKGQKAKRQKMSDRKAKILAVVKKSGPMTVSEIGEVVTEVSTKTIQRSLISLIEEGLLERAGERRWAKYSAA